MRATLTQNAPAQNTMIRSFAFTTQGRLHTKDIPTFLMPTLSGKGKGTNHRVLRGRILRQRGAHLRPRALRGKDCLVILSQWPNVRRNREFAICKRSLDPAGIRAK